MHIVSVVLKVLLALLAVTLVAHTVYSERRNLKLVTIIWSRFRLRMFFEILAVILQVVLVYSFLVWCSPLFKYGWMNLFLGMSGNMYIAPIVELTSADISWVRILPFMFFLLFLVAVPFMAQIEEKIFRKGHYEWPDMVKMSVVFGLIHCVVGVPLASGIALIGSGLFYAHKYRKSFLSELDKHGNWERAEEEAMLVSTTYHTLYNSVLVVILIVLLVITSLN